MAMTNAQIVLSNALELLDKGILKPSGRMFTQVMPDGSQVEIPEPEVIHTYSGWKHRGYQVRKGQKAVARFPIWKHGERVDEETGELTDERCFQKVAAWFTIDQVERIHGRR